jgi:predicted dehydrogenase
VFEPREYAYSEFDVEDLGVGFLRLEGGATVCLRASWAANVPEDSGATLLVGTRGGLRLKPFTLIENLGRYQAEVFPKVPAGPNVPFYGHRLAAAQMVKAIRGQEEPLVKKEEVLNVIRALEAVYRSAETGREVLLT